MFLAGRYLVAREPASLSPPIELGDHHPGGGKYIRAYSRNPQKPVQFLAQCQYGKNIGKIATGQTIMDPRLGAMQILRVQAMWYVHYD